MKLPILKEGDLLINNNNNRIYRVLRIHDYYHEEHDHPNDIFGVKENSIDRYSYQLKRVYNTHNRGGFIWTEWAVKKFFSIPTEKQLALDIVLYGK